MLEFFHYTLGILNEMFRQVSVVKFQKVFMAQYWCLCVKIKG